MQPARGQMQVTEEECAHLVSINEDRASNGGLLGSGVLKVDKGEALFALLDLEVDGLGAAQGADLLEGCLQLLLGHVLGQVAHEHACARQLITAVVSAQAHNTISTAIRTTIWQPVRMAPLLKHFFTAALLADRGEHRGESYQQTSGTFWSRYGYLGRGHKPATGCMSPAIKELQLLERAHPFSV